MNEQGFETKRRADWQRLTELCDRADLSLRRLDADELRELVRLYRRASTDLAIVRTRSSNASLIDFLNDLVARAYGILYRSPRQGVGRAIMQALAVAAQALRRHRAFVLASALVFFGAAVFAFVVLKVWPDTREVLIPPQYESNFQSWKEGRHPNRDASDSLGATAFYASNNPRVAVIAGAVGASSFGLLSLVLLFQNGALIGSLSHEVQPNGQLGFLLSSILPHGVPELSGAIVAGAAGLLLGWALVSPGRRSRGEALRAVGRDAIVLLATSVVMMFLAAPIEGFFSFNPSFPQWLKGFVGIVGLVAWLTFWATYGRSDDERRLA